MTDTLPADTSREPRPEKVAIVDEVKERLSGSSAALLAEYRGLKVSELATLRDALRAVGGDFKVYKNTLVRFAVRDLGVDLDEGMLTGPTAIAFVDGDAAGVAKALRDYARTNPNLVVKGGILGSSALSADEARALADLPSRDVLLSRLAGGLAAPLVGFAGLLQALPRNFAYGLKALIDQGGAPGAPADPEPAPAAEAEPPAEAEAAAAPEELTEAPAEAEAAAAPDDTTEAPAEAAAAPEELTDMTEAPVADAVATTDAAPAAEADATPAPADVADTTEAAPAVEADNEGEAAPATTDDTPEEAS